LLYIHITNDARNITNFICNNIFYYRITIKGLSYFALSFYLSEIHLDIFFVAFLYYIFIRQ